MLLGSGQIDRWLQHRLFMHRRQQRQREAEGAASADFAVHPDSSLVKLDKLLRKREPQARALSLPNLIAADLPELFKYPRLIFGGDADAGILHPDFDHVAGPRAAQPYLPAVGSKFDRVR